MFLWRGQTSFHSRHWADSAGNGPSVAEAAAAPNIPLWFPCHFPAQWPPYAFTCDIQCGREDTFKFASSAHSESWKSLETYTPPSTPRAAWTGDWWMQQYQYPSSLALVLWGVVALSLQLPLQDWANLSSVGCLPHFPFSHFPVPLLGVLKTLPNKPYETSSWGLFLGSWPKTAPNYLKV